jgi:hypothetical protein
MATCSVSGHPIMHYQSKIAVHGMLTSIQLKNMQQLPGLNGVKKKMIKR